MHKRVFFLNWAGHRLEPAERFSKDVVIITTGDQDLFELDRLRWKIETFLTKHVFNPDKDYVVLSGSSVMTYLLGTILGEQFQKVQILLWDAKKQGYKLQTHSTITIKPTT